MSRGGEEEFEVDLVGWELDVGWAGGLSLRGKKPNPRVTQAVGSSQLARLLAKEIDRELSLPGG